MPQRKTTSKSVSSIISRMEFFSKIKLGVWLKVLNVYLATIFLIIWIFVGIFLALLIAASFKQGFFESLLNQKATQTQTQEPAQNTEAQLPGVGMVNIDCTQKALSNESIQKVLNDENTSGLTDDEKTKLEPCIVQKEQATPAASPQ